MKPKMVIMSVRESVSDGLDHLGTGAARVGRGAVAGFIGGAIAAFLMNRYQEIETRRAKGSLKAQLQLVSGQAVPAPVVQQQDATDPKVKVAERVSRKLFDHELSDFEKKIASPAVHYGYGAVAGAVYGVLTELAPAVGDGMGIPFGTMLWLGGEEIGVPSLRLTKCAEDTSTAKHTSSLAMHFVYGMSLDISRRVLRQLLK